MNWVDSAHIEMIGKPLRMWHWTSEFDNLLSVLVMFETESNDWNSVPREKSFFIKIPYLLGNRTRDHCVQGNEFATMTDNSLNVHPKGFDYKFSAYSENKLNNLLLIMLFNQWCVIHFVSIITTVEHCKLNMRFTGWIQHMRIVLVCCCEGYTAVHVEFALNFRKPANTACTNPKTCN